MSFWNLNNLKYFYINFYSESFPFHPLWNIIITLINNKEEFTYKIVKKIVYKNKKIAFPININENKYGLFVFKNNSLILSIYQYPIIHLYDIEIYTDCPPLKVLKHLITMKDGRIVTFFDDRILHLTDIRKKEDTKIYLKGDNTEFSKIKQLNTNHLCLFLQFNPYKVVILNIVSYQIESYIEVLDNNNILLGISYFHFNMTNNQLEKILFKKTITQKEYININTKSCSKKYCEQIIDCHCYCIVLKKKSNKYYIYS